MNIKVDNLHFTYPNGVTALAGVSLRITAGEKIAIVGQNGAGKTTLVRHFNGLLQPTQGSVSIGDWDTRQHSVAQLARRVGYVFQNPDDQLFARTVADEIRVGPKNLGYPPEQIETLVETAIALCELEGEQAENPYDLSPAWRKMVALASIIAMDTPILILDEPTTGQDARSIARIVRIVQTLHEQGKTVVAITHDIDFCAENFRRIVVMGEGRILLDDDPHQVFAQEEILASTYVEPPQLARLGKRLGFDEPACTVEEFIAQLQARRAPAATSAAGDAP
jgi:energy-coupling factor transport system ATP-binding protein